MNISSVIAACLLISLSIHEIKYWKNVVITANKSKLEISATCGAIVGMAIITYIFAKNRFHYLMFVCGVLFVLADVWKQGISEAGLLITARGKELYKWTEIHHTEITVSDKVKIDYFVKPDSLIATQFYSVDNYDKIIELFQKHNISYK